MARIAFDNVSKVYGNGVPALCDLTLILPDGEFVVVTGPSGSGKSTLLRLIAGVEVPSNGILTIDGKDVADAPPEERDVAMVFQNYVLYPHFSVFENMAFGLRLRKLTTNEIKRRVDDVATQLQLDNILDRPPKELSGGQRQRFAIGRALVREPRIFLFDEPLSNLDAELRAHVIEFIQNRHAETGATTIYVTHNPDEVARIGGRIVQLQDGRIVGNSVVSVPKRPFSYAT